MDECFLPLAHLNLGVGLQKTSLMSAAAYLAGNFDSADLAALHLTEDELGELPPTSTFNAVATHRTPLSFSRAAAAQRILEDNDEVIAQIVDTEDVRPEELPSAIEPVLLVDYNASSAGTQPRMAARRRYEGAMAAHRRNASRAYTTARTYLDNNDTSSAYAEWRIHANYGPTESPLTITDIL